LLTQAEIIEKVGSAAAETFAVTVRGIPARVYPLYQLRITDVPTAEDLTSTVFEKALTKFRSYKPEKVLLSLDIS
jgi:DNA-directed RNA polymerase specialized sigma24 family protein